MSDGGAGELRSQVAVACRVLANEGLVSGVLGHVSARVGPEELVVRCRGADERGLRRTTPGDVWRVRTDGTAIDLPGGYKPPNELPIHTELMRQRAEVNAVVHAHPRPAVLCSLAGLQPRPVIGAYNIPAMRLAQEGVPVYDRPVLVTRHDLANELIAAMGASRVCIMTGHGITVAGTSVEQAVVTAVNLNVLLEVTLDLARLGAQPPEVSSADLAELPDLGQHFNDEFVWRSLIADLHEDTGLVRADESGDGIGVDLAAGESTR